LRGRLFTAAEDLPNAPNVVLISYRLWQSWFGGDDGAIGRTVQVRSRPATIIGVMPPGFYFRNRNVDLWEAHGARSGTRLSQGCRAVPDVRGAP
jgi:hypothetical protein